MSDAQHGQGAAQPGNGATEQDREYFSALEQAWESHDENSSPLKKARRRRVTSRAVMIALSVVAVFLAVGGVLAPQISYAREASRFQDIAEEVNVAADQAESLIALEESERLLFKLRSEEARELVAQTKRWSTSANKDLSPEFKSAMALATTDLETALGKGAVASAESGSMKKAKKARAAEVPDPLTWFDVDATQVMSLADIEVTEELSRADVEGTVTLERVQETKRMLDSHNRLVETNQAKVDAVHAKNETLSAVVGGITANVVTEAGRTAKATRARIAEAEAAENTQPKVSDEAWRAATDSLASATGALEAALQAEQFAIDQDGQLVGVAVGAEFPANSIRIPGGDAIRLKFIIPEIKKLIAAVEVERKAVDALREARAAARAAAEAAAAAPPQYFPDTGGGGAVTPDPGPTPTPDPPIDPPVDPPVDPEVPEVPVDPGV